MQKNNYQLADFTNYQPPEKGDFIGLFFVHFSEKNRENYHKKCIEWLKPDGTIILEAFSKDQLKFHSGTPQREDFHYTVDALMNDFSSLEIVSLEKVEKVLDEGSFHSGSSSLIRLEARKIIK